MAANDLAKAPHHPHMTARPVGVAGDRVLRTVPCKPDTQTNGPVGAHSGMPTPPVGPTVGLPPAVVALVLGAARGMAAVAAAGIVAGLDEELLLFSLSNSHLYVESLQSNAQQ